MSINYTELKEVIERDMIPKSVLEQIRAEIEQMRAKPDNMVKLIGDFISIDYVLGVINKYMEDKQ